MVEQSSRGMSWRFPQLDPYKHRYYLHAVGALAAMAFAYFVTSALPYYPSNWRALVVLALGIVWFISPPWGVPATLLAFALPISYNSGFGYATLLVFVCVGLAALLVFDPFTFLVFGLATVVTLVSGLSWLLFAAPLLLVMLRTGKGALRAALLAIWVEMLMFSAGLTRVGALIGGEGGGPLVSPHAAPVASLLDFSWMYPPDSAGDTFQFITGVIAQTSVDHPITLAQIGLWALAVGLGGALLYRPLGRDLLDRLPAFLRHLPGPARAVGVGALILVVGQLALTALLETATLDPVGVIIDTVSAALIVLLLFPLTELLYQSLTLRGHAHMRPSAVATAAARRESRTEESGDASKPAGARSARREVPKDTWDELVGVDDIKEEVLEAVHSQFDPKARAALKRMSLSPTRGVLLFGPPGTGKTKLARIMAHEAGAAFFAVSGTEFTSKWFGESEANLRRVFTEARENRPAILFFDELEAFLPRRGDLSRGDAPEKGIIATFLAFTDGVGDMDGVLLIGATNYPNLIDPAAMRPGRFDKMIYVSAPDQAARRAIFASYMSNKPVAGEIDLDKLAARSERFTGADIQLACTEAARKALRRAASGGAEPITMADLETSVGGIRPSVTFQMLREYQELADQYGRRSSRPDTVDVIAKPDLSWDDVAGLETVKEALRDAIEAPLKRPELFREYGIKPPKGVLLFGPPGCGKTYLAKVVASATGAHFLEVKGPELLQKYVGESEARLRDLFGRARENAPCVIFFDEIDAIAGARGTGDEGSAKMLTQFLTEMDGVDELKGVVVMAATNRPDTIDAALMRPGRLDRVLYVPPPDAPARRQLFQYELRNKPTTPDLALDALVARSGGYSAADIAAICNITAATAARDSLQSGEREVITTERLLTQLERTPTSISPEQVAMYEELRDKLQR
ncbi:MAG TPA: AAA family ATPase [Ktedonobacterales bacterium]